MSDEEINHYAPSNFELADGLIEDAKEAVGNTATSELMVAEAHVRALMAVAEQLSELRESVDAIAEMLQGAAQVRITAPGSLRRPSAQRL